MAATRGIRRVASKASGNSITPALLVEASLPSRRVVKVRENRRKGLGAGGGSTIRTGFVKRVGSRGSCRCKAPVSTAARGRIERTPRRSEVTVKPEDS